MVGAQEKPRLSGGRAFRESRPFFETALRSKLYRPQAESMSGTTKALPERGLLVTVAGVRFVVPPSSD